jgi:Protein of unknown function (DUF2950)
MKRQLIHILNSGLRFTVPWALLVIWAMAGAFPSVAQQPAQPTFPSAADATKSLFQAVQSGDEQAIANILGGPTELTSSRDPGQDKLEREMFVEKYQEMHRLSRETDRSVTLYIGAENWPFPIPILDNNGAWRFDADAGRKEVLYRRIGENELTAIAICHDFATSAKHVGAQPNMNTTEGGLATTMVARAAGESAGGDPVLSHGYYFRELPIRPASGTRQGTGGKATGGFALIAYPAEYRSSGVMTFIVTGDVIYEKDLGADTSALATAMAAFRKDTTWRPTDE